MKTLNNRIFRLQIQQVYVDWTVEMAWEYRMAKLNIVAWKWSIVIKLNNWEKDCFDILAENLKKHFWAKIERNRIELS